MKLAKHWIDHSDWLKDGDLIKNKIILINPSLLFPMVEPSKKTKVRFIGCYLFGATHSINGALLDRFNLMVEQGEPSVLLELSDYGFKPFLAD